MSELEESEALTLAGTMLVGRLAHVQSEQLSVVPVNFLLDGRDVLMRTTGDASSWLPHIGAPRVRWRSTTSCHGPAPAGASLIRGRLTEVTDPASVEHVLSGPLHVWPVQGGTTSSASSASR